MINKILFGAGMLAVTLIIQYAQHKKGHDVTFWSGTDVVFIMCVLGLLSADVGYFAGTLGYVLGDRIGGYAGWHKAGKED